MAAIQKGEVNFQVFQVFFFFQVHDFVFLGLKFTVISCNSLGFLTEHVTNFPLSGYQWTKRNYFNFGDRTEDSNKSGK